MATTKKTSKAKPKSRLNLRSTKEFENYKVTLLLYGEVGSGKTTFASTFPNPVFFVPEIAANEMVSLAHEDLNVITFNTLTEMDNQLKELGKAVNNNEIACNTIVIDNLTSIQLMLQDALKNGAKGGKMSYSEWDQYTTIFKNMLTRLHQLPDVHIIWIAHSDTERLDEERVIGDIHMAGKQAKKIFKSFPTMMLECRAIDRKAGGMRYMVQLRSHDIWTCKIKANPEKVAEFPSNIPSDYNNLAELMGWKTREEIEEGE